MQAMTMNERETQLWMDDGPAGAEFRREFRQRAEERSRADGGTMVEIYSADGAVMDAVRAPLPEWASE